MSAVEANLEYDAIVQAQRELVTVKQRCAAGLRPGEVLFVRVMRHERGARREEALVKVAKWRRGRISGHAVREPLKFPEANLARQIETFDDAAVVDWIIVKPGGAQEGNRLAGFRERRWEE
jgi:hypothetical protein